MPTYEYECSAYGHQLEIFQSMTEERLSKCPQCGKKTLARLIGAGGGIIFKTSAKPSSGPCSDSCACHPKN